MSIEAHVDSLAEKRVQLKSQIAEESARPAPNFVLITNLKKQNLALKEEMMRYLSQMNRQSAGSSS